MKVIFFSKRWKFYFHFQKSIKFAENVDGFEDNCVWTFCESFCQLWQEYMWSPVTLLKSGPKISDLTNWNDTQLTFFDINVTLP